MRQKSLVTRKPNNRWTLQICAAQRRFPVVVLAAALFALPGCSGGLPKLPKMSSLNPFGEKAPARLEGKRIPVMPQKQTVGGAELASAPVALPAMIQNAAWSQPGGTASNAPGHLQLSASIRRAWSASVGAGSSSAGRLTASPVVFGGRVYALDATAHVSAFASGSGARAWRLNLTPENERASEGFGGGLAVDSGRLYAATGFGRVTAIDPATGKKIWEKNVGIPIRSSPTAAQNKVFVVTTTGRTFCLNGDDGEILWEYRGLSETTQIASNPSPAVEGDVVALPYPNGDVVAIQVSTGTPLWSDSLARTRGATTFASMSDAARPAMAGGTVYAVGHAGRMIATRQDTGERVWSLNVPGMQTPWVAGDNVFVVDLSGKLSAFTRADGQLVWSVQLPDARNWSGPALAGGLLWLASDKGGLIGVEATAGRVAQKLSIDEPVFIAPVVAGGMLFVLTDKGRLVAFR
jgi:outer membrane protein assembly factor BamB